MNLFKLFRRSRSNRPAARSRPTFRPTLEGLEDRMLMSASVVPLVNPGFEDVSVGQGAWAYAYDPRGPGWNFQGGAGVTANYTNFTGLNPTAPQGSQVAFIQGNGSMSQTIQVSGGNYSLSFQAAQRFGNHQEIQILVDGTVVDTITPYSTSYSKCTTPEFSLNAGYHTIEFLGLNPYGGDNTAFLDQVSLNTNPCALTSELPWLNADNLDGLLAINITGLVANNSAGLVANNSAGLVANNNAG